MPRIDKTHNACGRGCPMIMIELNKAINAMQTGQVLEFLADDQTALLNIESWSGRTGHGLLDMSDDGQTLRFVIRKNKRRRNVERVRNFSRY